MTNTGLNALKAAANERIIAKVFIWHFKNFPWIRLENKIFDYDGMFKVTINIIALLYTISMYKFLYDYKSLSRDFLASRLIYQRLSFIFAQFLSGKKL